MTPQKTKTYSVSDFKKILEEIARNAKLAHAIGLVNFMMIFGLGLLVLWK